jgi:hypothetical protein
MVRGAHAADTWLEDVGRGLGPFGGVPGAPPGVAAQFCPECPLATLLGQGRSGR